MKYFNKSLLTETILYVKTSKNLVDYISMLDIVGKILYTDSVEPKQQLLSSSLDIRSYNYLLKILEISNISIDNVTHVSDLIHELKNESRNIHQVKLVLAFEPTQVFIESLLQWIIKNVTDEALLNYEVNNRIIGGVIIIYKGKYLDYSISPQIDLVYSEKKYDVQKLLD